MSQMNQRQELVQTISNLIQSVEPRIKGMHPDELKETLLTEYRIDLDEDDEDKLEAFSMKLVQRKKTMSARAMATPMAPPKGTTPGLIAKDVMCSTQFKVAERVKHLNRPDWGEGDVLSIQVFGLTDPPRQKLDIMFNRVGRKTLIVAPGMLESIPRGPLTGPVETPAAAPAETAKTS
jgi:hypothetical protein